jgi:RND family efflux transporter MFP subunit
MNTVPSEHSAEPETEPEIRRAGTPTVLLATVVFLISLAALFFIGWLPRHRQGAEAGNDAAELAGMVPVLVVSHPKETAGEGNVTLPCDVKADQEASIQTRANGYLKVLHADLGDKVLAGQLLAEIDAPEIDAELARGQASLLQARANLAKSTTGLELAERSLKRYHDLARGAASVEDIDVKTSSRDDAANVVAQENANVAYAEAEVKRLTALQEFGRVTAPFSGRISARSYDVGALISPGNGSSGTELFRLVKSDFVRVFVHVPQVYASDVTEGGPVVLRVRNEPGKDFAGQITRKAGEFDEATRTMLFEARVPNPDGRLYPGTYGQLQVALASRKPVLVISTSSLLSQGDGTRVVVVQDGVAHWKKVVVGRDFGADIEVSTGLTKDDWVALSPPAQITEGGKVKAMPKAEVANPAAK